MKNKSKRKNSRHVKKVRKPILPTEDDYETVLVGLVEEVESAIEIGQGAAIFIRPNLSKHKTIETASFYFDDTKDKEFYRAIKKALNDPKKWAVWTM